MPLFDVINRLLRNPALLPDASSSSVLHINTQGQAAFGVCINAPPRNRSRSSKPSTSSHMSASAHRQSKSAKPTTPAHKSSPNRYNYSKSLHFRRRPQVWLKKKVSVLANNGTRATLTPALSKQKKFITSGCTGNRCVIYSSSPYYTNPDGTTFFGYVPKSALYTKGHKSVTRARGATPPPRYNTRAVKRYTIASHDYRPELAQITGNPTADIVHGPGARMWEYTSLAGGKYVSGAETPASYWSHAHKLGTGYTTGTFRPGQKFYDIGGQTVKTAIRLDTEAETGKGATGSGTADWRLGYVKDHGQKVWTWMIDKMNIAGHSFAGNINT